MSIVSVEFIAALFVVTLALQPPIFAAETRRLGNGTKTLKRPRRKARLSLRFLRP